MKAIRRLKAVQDLLKNPEMVELLTEYRLATISGMTILSNQLETEDEQARYWLRQQEEQIFKASCA